MEDLQQRAYELLDPIDKVRYQVTTSKSVEFFGENYEEQEYPKALVGYIDLQNTVLSTIQGLVAEGTIKRDLTVESLEEIEDRTLEDCTPESFYDNNRVLSDSGEIIPSDIVKIVGGTIITCKSMNLVGEKELTPEEE